MGPKKRRRENTREAAVQEHIEVLCSTKLSTIGRFAGPVSIVFAAVYMLNLSWGKWPDVLVDFGKELYIPWQLTEGKVLYRDIAYFLGPLSAYVNSLWFRLFGVSLRTLVICNIVIMGILIALLYQLLTFIGNRFSATVGLVVFVFTFACSQMVGYGNYNFITPYTHEITHGTVLSVAALFCFSLYVRCEKRLYLAGSGFALGLAFLTRPEPCFAGILAVASGIALMFWDRRLPWRKCGGGLALFIATAAFPSLIALGLLCFVMPVDRAARGVLTPWLSSLNIELSGLHFYRAGMGLEKPGANLVAMLGSAGKYGLIFVPVALSSLALKQLRRFRTAIAVVCFAAVAAGLGGTVKSVVWFESARPLPLFMVLIAGVCLVWFIKAERKTERRTKLIVQMTTTVFALVMLLKMVLNARIYHYGFVLAMPATLVLVLLLVNWIPAGISRLGGCGVAFSSVALAVICVWICAVHLLVLRRYETKTIPVGNGADSFLADERGTLVQRMLTEISKRVGPQQTFAVLPEGVMLNYLSRRINPTPYFNFMPTEFATFGEHRIFNAFIEHPPDFIVLAHKDTSEFGYRFFGTHYGQKIGVWISENYHPVVRAGAPPLRDHRFGIMLLQRARSN